MIANAVIVTKKFFEITNQYFEESKPEGKRPLGRPRCRWVVNIGMDVGDARWGDVNWIGLAQDRNRWRALVNSVLSLRVP
jgi:hypothetical protein